MTANIDLISASAGSGKTYRLANEIIRAIDEGVSPEHIVATTFTNKAAAELVQRIRSFLLKSGKWHEAQQIINGYVGTVNSICGRFLKTFCFEAGLPGRLLRKRPRCIPIIQGFTGNWRHSLS